MLAQPGQARGTGQTRRQHIVTVALGQDHAAHHACIPGPMGQGDGDDHVGQAGTQQGDQKERQHQGGEGQEHVAQTHQEHVDLAPDNPGDTANHYAQYQHQAQHQHHAAQGQLRADDQPRKYVATQVVGAQPVAGTGGQQAFVEIHQRGVVRRQPGAEQRHQQQQGDQRITDARPVFFAGVNSSHGAHAITPEKRVRGSSQA